LVNMDDPDVLEIWNLVFMQYNREADKSLKPLPRKHIDCGLGLERLVSVIQKKRSNYDTDLFQPLFKAIQAGTGAAPYSGKVGADDEDGLDMAYRVLADHARTLTIALSDGGRPDNVGRGYVLRRILRRGVRYASEKLNAKPGFFASLVNTVVEILGETFPEVKKDPGTVIDIINEEETQFLKTLNRGQKLLQRTILKLNGAKELPGDIAWRLYDTYGFPVDLTQLMSEEMGLQVDLNGYESCKAAAQLASQGKGAGVEDKINLDVHSINELKDKGFTPTDDSAKYAYKPESTDKLARYKFNSCTGKILAIRKDKQFVNSVNSGEECGILLDKTCFYAEQGGQIHDEGFIVKGDNEMKVKNVQIRGGFVLHMGTVEGVLQVGDAVELSIDEERRKNVMNNHSGTHILNFALRQVLTSDADQRGSLVAPDKLRFDFTNKAAMTADQVKKVEDVANTMIDKNEEVYAKEASLAVAKSIQGLRAVFDETYPDPVRVVSIGVPVPLLEQDPSHPRGTQTSVEFCGGTHLCRAGHMEHMVIASEEAIAKGIRRIVALTGPEARKALAKEKLLEAEVEKVRQKVVGQNDITMKEKVRLITELTDEISAAIISYHKKDFLRNELKNMKKKMDDADRAKMAAMMGQVVDNIKCILGNCNNLPYMVLELHAFANNKAVDGALKQVRSLTPEMPTMFFSGDENTGKILCMAYAPKSAISRGLKANEWCGSVQKLINGKGGGKPDNAQASGTNVQALSNAMNVAHSFAMEKLGVGKVSPPTTGKGDNKTSASACAESSSAAVGPSSGTVSAPSGSTSEMLIKICAKYVGQSVNTQPADKFSFKSDSCILTTPSSAAHLICSKNQALIGTTPALQASVLQYVMYFENDLRHYVAGWVNPTKSWVEGCNPGTVASNKAVLFNHLEVLNTVLLRKTFLVGERLSLADIVACITLLPAFLHVLDGAARNKLRHVTRWFNTIIHQDPVNSVLGDIVLCEKEAQPVLPGGGGNKEKGKKDKKKQ